MTTTNDTMIDVLNDLIETLQDGVDGYRRAAEDVEGADLKALFQSYADQRASFKTELQAMVAQLGGDPETDGSTAASLHRGWIDLKSKLTGRDNASILEECENGDDHAVKGYEKVLDKHNDLPAPIRATLLSQHTTIQQAHQNVRSLAERLD